MLRLPTARIWLPLLILLVVIALTFGPSLRNDFVNWDDQSEITQNPDFNPVSMKGLAWNWSHTRLTLYMPITYMVWAAVASVAPRDSGGMLRAVAFHGLNLFLHFVCSALVFLLIFQLWKKAIPALIGALIFAVHPLQVEAVVWASGMYTVLSTALSLGALMAYTAYARRANEMRTSNIEHRSKCERRFFSSMFAFDFCIATSLYILALLCKAASVSLPLAAAVIDIFIIGRPIKRVIRSLALWVLLGIPIILAAKSFQDLSQIASPPLWGRPVVALDAAGFYLRKILLPINLIPDYGRNPNWVMQHPLAASISTATAIIALLLAWIARRKAAWVTAGIALLIVGLSPYLGLTAFDFQYVSTVADRYAYFGLVGLAVLAAGAVIRSRAAALGLIIAIAMWAVLSHRQVQKWHDTTSLFAYTLQVNPRSLVSHNVFGFIAASEHRPAEAEAQYLKALQIWPEDATIQFNLGNLYLHSRPDLALQRYALAVQYQPKFAAYRNNYAAALLRTGHVQEAYNQWAEAIKDDPEFLDARNNFAELLVNLNRIPEARQEYQSVLQIDPTNAPARQALEQLEIPGGK